VIRGRAASSAIAAAAAVCLAGHLSGAAIPHPQAAEAMNKFLSQPASPHQYRAARRLEASGAGQRGWLDVDTRFTAASGLEYEVTAEGGSRYIRARVLRPLLDEEQRLIASGHSATVAISLANYAFGADTITDDGLAVVNITPHRKERALIRGRLFLAPVEGDLVRVEGTLARNPSFWVTRVAVVRFYRRIEGVVMPVSLDTTAQLRLFGSSALRMTYRYSEIDDRPVAADPAEP
jgi:hypothetical protein